jgi:hypothetical protein
LLVTGRTSFILFYYPSQIDFDFGDGLTFEWSVRADKCWQKLALLCRIVLFWRANFECDVFNVLIIIENTRGIGFAHTPWIYDGCENQPIGVAVGIAV